MELRTTGQGIVTYHNQRDVRFYIEPLDNKEKWRSEQIDAVTLPAISTANTHIGIDPKEFEHCKDRKFTEDFPTTLTASKKYGTIDVLLGLPWALQMIKPGQTPIFGRNHSDPIVIPLKVGDALVVATSNDEDEEIESMATDLGTMEIDLSGLMSLESLGITDDIEPSEYTYSPVQKSWAKV